MISVIIPAFNECDAIDQTVKEARTHLTHSGLCDAQIIVVDDHSSDGTGDKARAAGAHVLYNSERLGYGRSIKIGITNASFDTIVIMDGDLSYPADAISGLLEDYHQGCDMAVGQRTGPHFPNFAIHRRMLRALVEFVTGRHIPDINSGMRVFDRRNAYPYFDYLCDSFSFTTSLTLTYMMNQKLVTYRPIEYRKRCGESKVRLVRDSIRTLYYIFICSIRFRSVNASRRLWLCLARRAD